MNMLNRNCKTSFAKPEFLKKAQRANPRLYDIGCYNDNLALMLAPDSDETIRLEKERRSKLSDLIRPFDYDQLNNLYDLTRQPMAVPVSTREPKHNVNQSVATFNKKTVATDSTVKKSRNITRKLYEQVSKTCSWWYPKYTPSGYNWKPKTQKGNVNPNITRRDHSIHRRLGCSKHMTGNLKLLTNFVEKFLGTVKFGNDQIAPILGYGDLVQGTITIKRVYYVEGLNHNLFSVGQFWECGPGSCYSEVSMFIYVIEGK
ncbi:hypothetical protein Tco_0973972 [Tanacetum coccineum]|uniref:Retrovirus-related Pol polyprotein from transposon TNT 1-94-like beta-barrel domain-containing protein n=1 Tax=Tanacetum coccineum TaxID=301880 RepID=A0ABQ5EAA7_9ASTR